MPDAFTVLIMAAGQGTRMRSRTPKVLHRVCGKPMVEWVVDSAREAGAGRVVCVVRPGDGVAQGLPDGVEVAEQREGEGTGAAVLAAREVVEEGPVVVLSGDQPLITARHLAELVESHVAEGAGATLLTTDQLDPTGYGRIVRSPEGEFERIVETKYTEGVPPEELAIREVNLGTYVFEAPGLFEALDEVGDENGERYLTGVFPLLQADGEAITTHLTEDAEIALGVNDRADLMNAEESAQRRLLEQHARGGVTFLHPGTCRVEAHVTIGPDTTIGPGVSLLGSTSVGPDCELGPHTTLIDCRVDEGATVIQVYG
ncbi:MAG: NTP transferase domain-containing protein, partial [Pseudonocardiaceae bacterium]